MDNGKWTNQDVLKLLGILLAVITTVSPAYIMVFTNNNEISSLKESNNALKIEVRANTNAFNKQAVEFGKLQTQLGNIEEGIDRIERSLTN
jgi:Tfp pilus assembly protein PilO